MDRFIKTGALVAAILFLAVFVSWPAFSYADDGSLVPPSSIWFEVWQIVQPIVVLVVSIVGPAFAAWISARLLSLLKVTDENQRLALEAKLRDALHQSAANALKFALTKAGVSAAVPTVISTAVLNDAVRYVQEKNPDALAKLGVGTDALLDIIQSKVPDLASAAIKPGA